MREGFKVFVGFGIGQVGTKMNVADHHDHIPFIAAIREGVNNRL
jgi:hypothetical protein